MGASFSHLCPEIEERLDQIYAPELLFCLNSYAPPPYSFSADASDCSTPALNAATGRFDYDLCLGGDDSRCKA